MIDASHQIRMEGSREVPKNAVKIDLEVSQAVKPARATEPLLVDYIPGSLDLNQVCVANRYNGNDEPACSSDFDKCKIQHGAGFATSEGYRWDLNLEDVCSSLNQEPLGSQRNSEHFKTYESSECGSTSGPLGEKDSMKVWKEMKQNGFLSSFRVSKSVPKPRMRKRKNDELKKRMEFARREQVDRFARVAAPSGLLNKLNPGIINHVRNRKQVRSIIEAFVRSERLENSHACGTPSTNSGAKQFSDRKDHEYMNGTLMNSLALSQEDTPWNGCLTSFTEPIHCISDHVVRDTAFSKVNKWVLGNDNHAYFENHVLRLSSDSIMASGITRTLSNEDMTNGACPTNVSSVSLGAATVASQWLELLREDINGRLGALRCSKQRVQAVIHTELPCLISREFSCHPENDSNILKSSDTAAAHAHRARWMALFNQMDKGLCEEEKQLEVWLAQLREMQLRCERGLQHFHYGALHGPQHMGTLENNSRLKVAERLESELAVKAAAASIYSTCNLLMSSGNW